MPKQKKKRPRTPPYDQLNFSTAGAPLSTPGGGGTLAGMKHALKLNCDGMEIEWVRRVGVNDETASELKSIRKKTGCALTAHGPYFINLNSPEDRIINSSYERIVLTARRGVDCGCTSFTFHAAFMMGAKDRRPVHKRVIGHLKKIQNQIEKEKLNIIMRPELTGKDSAWGRFEELIDASLQVPGIQPCIDWSHLHARTNGKYNTRDEFRAILKEYASALGDDSLRDMHMHLSGIAYGEKGEKHHLLLKESDFNYKDLFRTFREFDVRGVLVCESPSIETDTILMKRSYSQMKNQ
ncbi:MAG TPA: TIM barrel protein [bacterium]